MKALPVLGTLAICGASGALFSALHAPLPWMIGPLLAMALGKFLGANVAAPSGGLAAGNAERLDAGSPRRDRGAHSRRGESFRNSDLAIERRAAPDRMLARLGFRP